MSGFGCDVGATLTREELVLSTRISEVVSAGAERELIAFTQKRILDGGKSSATDLWLHNATSKRTTQMTRFTKGGCSNPVFAMGLPGAEDSLLYTKGADGQVWTLPLEGGESAQVTDFPMNVEGFKVFRGTGTKIWMLCTLSVYPGCTPVDTAARDKAKEGGTTGMVFDQLMVRHWDTWNCYEKRNHLFLVKLEVQENGLLKALCADCCFDTMPSWHTDAPSKPFGGTEDYAASSDGEHVAMVCRRVNDDGSQPKDFSWSTAGGVYVMKVPTQLHETNVSAFTAAAAAGTQMESERFDWQLASDPSMLVAVGSPSWSPDGRKLAYLSMQRPQYESDHMQVWVWDLETQKRSNVSGELDLSFGSVSWDVASVTSSNTGDSSSDASAGQSTPGGGKKRRGSVKDIVAAWGSPTATILADASSANSTGNAGAGAGHESMAAAAAAAMTAEDEHYSPIVSAMPQFQLYCAGQYRASNRIFRLTLANDASALGSIDVMVGDESRGAPLLASANDAFTHKDKRVIYFTESSLQAPAQLQAVDAAAKVFAPFVFAPAESGEQVVMPAQSYPYFRTMHCPCPQYMNGDVQVPQLSQFYFPSRAADGSVLSAAEDLVHCWYMPPAHMQESDDEDAAAPASVPLLLIVHGGPQGAITNAWNYRWNMAYYASLGYAVVAVNFHGSSGFGVRFLDSIRGQWGGQPYRDCMACVDFTLAQKPYLDTTRVAALGASYGGYMMNWINGHDPERKFKCLVNHDGIFGLKNLYYTTEEQWFPEWEFGVPYVTNPSDFTKKDARYDRSSAEVDKTGPSQYDLWDPSLFVDQWNTPTLVIQGCKDYRVVETEGLATFTALQRRGVPSRLLVFPDENHWCLRPINSLTWYGTVTDWLAGHLQEQQEQQQQQMTGAEDEAGSN